MSSSEIVSFYTGKNFFITGSSGFVGICLLEKILRVIPNHGQIYLLLRPKKGKDINERLEEIKKNQIFEKLLANKSVEDVFRGVQAVAGDVGQENLGISPEDRRLLVDNVNVIIHSAATLDFGDTLKTTVNINLLGTRRVTQLAKDCKQLKVLVHVSSAYVNSYRLDCEEIIYDKPCDSEELISLVGKLNEAELEKKTPEILKDHPNTYTITKHLAEHEIKNCETIFPCTIVRPSMIIGAWKEPIPGWTISKNGPQGFLMGAAKGVIRRLPVGKSLIYDYIPVDVVVNNLLAAGYSAANHQAKQVEVYHCTSSTRNPFSWILIEDRINNYLHEYPLKSAVWYPYLKFLPSVTWYKISAFFVHILPAILLDFVTRVAGGRPILMKLHRNVNTSLDRLEKFIFTEWKFHANKTMELHKSLSKTDQDMFILDITHLVWLDYFKDLAVGARVYLNREPLKNLAGAKTKDNILMILHLAMQAALFSLIWYLFACIFGMKMSSSAFVVPIGYFIFSLL
ncbi:putative fatty acyl-CoA reductase CG8306 [Tribolium madens]|uniref:putative fatty acyl-CoA reductase CG8306 n=1 Tax=Tribolium madens TaxID=41895 RepID=UPI001CF75797|nr:putative fatty acyl-CoA reductase CG8306 [Tribolium madens]